MPPSSVSRKVQLPIGGGFLLEEEVEALSRGSRSQVALRRHRWRCQGLDQGGRYQGAAQDGGRGLRRRRDGEHVLPAQGKKVGKSLVELEAVAVAKVPLKTKISCFRKMSLSRKNWSRAIVGTVATDGVKAGDMAGM